VLTPGGTLMVSVPDFDTLCRLFLLPNIDLNTRFRVMRMAFGGHLDPHDVHHTGFNFDLLAYFLSQAGFREIQRVEQFGLFQDTSAQKFGDEYISLNVIAGKSV
jgi:predicted SAM-dependent methyltransferase